MEVSRQSNCLEAKILGPKRRKGCELGVPLLVVFPPKHPPVLFRERSLTAIFKGDTTAPSVRDEAL